MHDYSEGMLEIKRLLSEAEKLCLKRDYDAAREVVEAMKSECDRLANWLWDNLE